MQHAALFGPSGGFVKVNPEIGIQTIPDATCRFLHGEISCWREYKNTMDNIMNAHMASLDADHADFDEKTRCYMAAANSRLHGKSAIEMFVCLEVAVDLARARNPNVAFRKYLHTALLGLLALQQAVGPWLGVTSASGERSFTVAPIRAFQPIGIPGKPLEQNILFDYIQLLFPSVSRTPASDSTHMRQKMYAMQKRINGIHNPVHQFGTYHLQQVLNMWLGLDTNPNGNRTHSVANCLSTISMCGTTEDLFFYKDKAEIKSIDAIMLPLLEECFYHARSVSGFWD
jgi:hypothetical protein